MINLNAYNKNRTGQLSQTLSIFHTCNITRSWKLESLIHLLKKFLGSPSLPSVDHQEANADTESSRPWLASKEDKH
jgi:hypothetical protein